MILIATMPSAVVCRLVIQSEAWLVIGYWVFVEFLPFTTIPFQIFFLEYNRIEYAYIIKLS